MTYHRQMSKGFEHLKSSIQEGKKDEYNVQEIRNAGKLIEKDFKELKTATEMKTYINEMSNQLKGAQDDIIKPIVGANERSFEAWKNQDVTMRLKNLITTNADYLGQKSFAVKSALNLAKLNDKNENLAKQAVMNGLRIIGAVNNKAMDTLKRTLLQDGSEIDVGLINHFQNLCHQCTGDEFGRNEIAAITALQSIFDRYNSSKINQGFGVDGVAGGRTIDSINFVISNIVEQYKKEDKEVLKHSSELKVYKDNTTETVEETIKVIAIPNKEPRYVLMKKGVEMNGVKIESKIRQNGDDSARMIKYDGKILYFNQSKNGTDTANKAVSGGRFEIHEIVENFVDVSPEVGQIKTDKLQGRPLTDLEKELRIMSGQDIIQVDHGNGIKPLPLGPIKNTYTYESFTRNNERQDAIDINSKVEKTVTIANGASEIIVSKGVRYKVSVDATDASMLSAEILPPIEYDFNIADAIKSYISPEMLGDAFVVPDGFIMPKTPLGEKVMITDPSDGRVFLENDGQPQENMTKVFTLQVDDKLGNETEYKVKITTGTVDKITNKIPVTLSIDNTNKLNTLNTLKREKVDVPTYHIKTGQTPQAIEGQKKTTVNILPGMKNALENSYLQGIETVSDEKSPDFGKVTDFATLDFDKHGKAEFNGNKITLEQAISLVPDITERAALRSVKGLNYLQVYQGKVVALQAESFGSDPAAVVGELKSLVRVGLGSGVLNISSFPNIKEVVPYKKSKLGAEEIDAKMGTFRITSPRRKNFGLILLNDGEVQGTKTGKSNNKSQASIN